MCICVSPFRVLTCIPVFLFVFLKQFFNIKVRFIVTIRISYFCHCQCLFVKMNISLRLGRPMTRVWRGKRNKRKYRRRKDGWSKAFWKAKRKNCAHGCIMRARDGTKAERDRSKPKKEETTLLLSEREAEGRRILKIIHHRARIASAVTFTEKAVNTAGNIHVILSFALFSPLSLAPFNCNSMLFVMKNLRICEHTALCICMRKWEQSWENVMIYIYIPKTAIYIVVYTFCLN